MKKMKALSFVCIAAFAVSGFSYEYLYKPDRVIVSEAEYLYDITDKNLVVDSAESVIVGTVIERLDVQEDEVGVYTPYKIRVEESLKGELPVTSEILISQRIGYDNNEKATIKMSKNDEYLNTGESFIFSLRLDERDGIHRIIVPEYGNVKIKEVKEKKFDSSIVNSYKEVALKVKSKQ
ncbi:hypothetical protein NM897_17055 (plasmid) [Planococcus maritimus]|uniref:hypothetical protein n=1 Tax=Planococcus maritimus TaxID=192421 RepID=UPI00313900B6